MTQILIYQYSKNFVAIHEIKPVLNVDKPFYVEFSVSELSRLFRYGFHYNHIKRNYNAKLLFTDTDSLIYEIGTYDISKIILSCFDYKRFILDDGINTLAYFDKDTRSQ